MLLHARPLRAMPSRSVDHSLREFVRLTSSYPHKLLISRPSGPYAKSSLGLITLIMGCDAFTLTPLPLGVRPSGFPPAVQRSPPPMLSLCWLAPGWVSGGPSFSLLFLRSQSCSESLSDCDACEKVVGHLSVVGPAGRASLATRMRLEVIPHVRPLSAAPIARS